MINGGKQASAGAADRFAQSWHALRSDPSVQFDLTPPSPPPQPPAWLKDLLNAIGRVFSAIGRAIAWLWRLLPDAEYARILLLCVIGIGAALLLYSSYNWLKHGEWRIRRLRRVQPADVAGDDEWRPDESGVRSWLEEADAYARAGLYKDAIHHLLFRSVQDITDRRPSLVRPSLTSRELASAPAIPARARELFASIAQLVEHSLFGGRPVGEIEWVRAREAYTGFALPSAWRK